MTHRAWLFIVALGLIVATSSAPAQEAIQPHPENEVIGTPRPTDSGDGDHRRDGNDQADTSDVPEDLSGVEAAINNVEAEENQEERQRQRENEQRDLDAQEAMAKWAKWMFWTSAVMAVLTALALFAIVRTLHHTRRAADASDGMLKEAIVATRAAQDAVEATRDVGEAQVRAYLSIASVFFDIGEDLRHCKVAVVVNNSGNSPARISELRAESRQYNIEEYNDLDPAHGAIEFPLTGEILRPTAGAGIVASGGQVTYAHLPFRDSALRQRFLDQENYLVVGIDLAYIDVFKRERPVRQMFMVRKSELTNREMRPLQHGAHAE